MYKEKMEELLNKNDFLIIDRYVYSNIAYQSAKDKITSLVKLIRFTSKIENYEFEKLQLPAIDYLIFLNMRHYNCVKLMKNREKDINENDSYFLSEVYSNYRLIIATIEHKIKTLSVKCQSESDDIFSPEKISSEIFDFLSLGRKNV